MTMTIPEAEAEVVRLEGERDVLLNQRNLAATSHGGNWLATIATVDAALAPLRQQLRQAHRNVIVARLAHAEAEAATLTTTINHRIHMEEIGHYFVFLSSTPERADLDEADERDRLTKYLYGTHWDTPDAKIQFPDSAVAPSVADPSQMVVLQGKTATLIIERDRVLANVGQFRHELQVFDASTN